MWFNQLFTDKPIDFERRCRMRIKAGIGFIFLGVLAMGMTAVLKGGIPILYPEPGAEEYISQFYWALGMGLVAGGLAKILQNRRFLKNPGLKKSGEIAEGDERNRLMGLRCWAYTGYSMFLVLYLGMLVGGLVSLTVVKTIMTLLAAFALLLFIFRWILRRSM